MAGSAAGLLFFFRNNFTELFKKGYQIHPKIFFTNILCLESTPMMKTHSFFHHVSSVATRTSSSGKLVSSPEKRLDLPGKIDFVIAK